MIITVQVYFYLRSLANISIRIIQYDREISKLIFDMFKFRYKKQIFTLSNGESFIISKAKKTYLEKQIIVNNKKFFENFNYYPRLYFRRRRILHKKFCRRFHWRIWLQSYQFARNKKNNINQSTNYLNFLLFWITLITLRGESQ